jgi:hypothetical protein
MGSPNALISCPSCDRPVSRFAPACPYCGGPSANTLAYQRRARHLANQALVCRLIVWVSFFAFFVDLKDGEVWIIAWCAGMFGCLYTKAARRNHGG